VLYIGIGLLGILGRREAVEFCRKIYLTNAVECECCRTLSIVVCCRKLFYL